MKISFLVAYYATLKATLLVGRSIGQSVGRSVRNKVVYKAFYRVFDGYEWQRRNLAEQKAFSKVLMKKKFVSVRLPEIFESADARDLGLMTLFAKKCQKGIFLSLYP